MMHRCRWLLVVFALAAVPVRADEGMWLLDHPPRALLQKRYQFELTGDWLNKVQHAAVRFNNGGSGSFVSPHGLVVTNHHIGADALLKLSTKDKDLYRDGFYARTPADELPCPDLELNVLEETSDVTAQVQAAVNPEMTPAAALAARKAVIAKIARESQAATGLRSDVVTFFQGAQYHLYRYKKYTEVRLVMAPEHAVAFFGGDSDNFEYPRYNLDICFFRVYDKGKPIESKHYFPWSTTGPADGDLVFVAGHPGTTNRLETLDHLKHRRNVTLPFALQMLRQREALLSQYAQTGPVARLHAQEDLFSTANARKALTGQYHGLLTPSLLALKARQEQELRAGIEPVKTGKFPWVRVAEVYRDLAEFERRYLLLEKGDAFDSRLFHIARHLVRMADELPRDDGKRLGEYRSASVGSLKFQLLSPAPIHADLERVKLTGSLVFLAESLGAENPIVTGVFAGKGPAELVDALISGTKLHDVKERQRLLEAGKAGIEASTDSMIQFARRLDAEARVLRQRHDELSEIGKQAYTEIAQAQFAHSAGTEIAPDATFTLRLAFGVVKGYREPGRELPYTTTLRDIFIRAEEQGNREPFDLPRRWIDGKGKLDLATPFNFVSTADTIGGNSGSPVLNRAGELVGINFDRNRHGLVRNFIYTEEQARHISVHARAVLETLRQLYDAAPLLDELLGKR